MTTTSERQAPRGHAVPDAKELAFGTIVLAVDGSEGSQAAIPLAAGLARRDGAKLVVAHVDEVMAVKGGAEVHADEDDIKANVHRLAKELSHTGIATQVEITGVLGEGPAHSICEIADRVGADLIVVGTRGHSALASALLGSVAQRVLHHANQPVLVAKRPAS